MTNEEGLLYRIITLGTEPSASLESALGLEPHCTTIRIMRGYGGRSEIEIDIEIDRQKEIYIEIDR